jgi:NAD(P)-dependent dehydrogenase (short-subunit alcohol dehydrogenase family)
MSAHGTVTPAALITGASSGIGRATAIELARRGHHVVLVCRDHARGQVLQDELASLPGAAGSSMLTADLSSLAQVRELALRVLALPRRPQLLINNAATWSRTRQVTSEGFERTLTVNYFAPFVLTHWLLPMLRAAPPARIVNVTSNVVRQFSRLDLADLQATRSYHQLRAYRQSKLALLLFTRELGAHEAATRLTVNCLHPGDVLTNMTARGFFIDLIRPFLPRVSAHTAALACADLALSPELGTVTGAYFEQGHVTVPNTRYAGANMGRALWAETWRLLADYLPPTAAANRAAGS